MDISQKINTLRKLKNLTQKELASKADISITGLQKAMEKNDYKISFLIKISEILDVPITYFFDESSIVKTTTNSNNKLKNSIGDNSSQNITLGKKENEIEGLKIEIKAIKEQIEEYKTIIKQKDEMIEKLLKMNN